MKAVKSIDTFNCSLWVEWDNPQNLFSVLEELKKAAKEEASFLELEEHEYMVERYGLRPGGRGCPTYPYLLMDQGIALMLKDKQYDKKQNETNVFVQCRAMYCICTGGVPDIYADIFNRITRLGGIIHKNSIARVDVACDVVGGDFLDMDYAFKEGRIISNVRKYADYQTWSGLQDEQFFIEGTDTPWRLASFMNSKKPTGFYCGSELLARVYNKKEELKSDPLKARALADFVWKDEDALLPEGKGVVRSEFQMRGDTLKDFIVKDSGPDPLNTIEGFTANEEGLCHYLTHDYIRFTSARVDRTNTTRAHTLPLWEQFQIGFTSAVSNDICRKPKEFCTDAAKLIPGGIGYFMNIAVARGIDTNSPDKLAAFVSELIREEADGGKIEKAFKDKVALHKAHTPKVLQQGMFQFESKNGDLCNQP